MRIEITQVGHSSLDRSEWMDPDVPKPSGDAEARVTERLRQADDADRLSLSSRQESNATRFTWRAPGRPSLFRWG
jgi:hypothetical protein